MRNRFTDDEHDFFKEYDSYPPFNGIPFYDTFETLRDEGFTTAQFTFFLVVKGNIERDDFT